MKTFRPRMEQDQKSPLSDSFEEEKTCGYKMCNYTQNFKHGKKSVAYTVYTIYCGNTNLSSSI